MEWTIKYREDVDAYQATAGDRQQWMDLQENYASGLRVRLVGDRLHVHARVMHTRWYIIPDPQLMDESARLAVQVGETFARTHSIDAWVYLRHLELTVNKIKTRAPIKRPRPQE